MGRSTTPRYRIDAVMTNRRSYVQAWNCERYGTPTLKSAARWREAINKSFLPGGVNFGISESLGRIERVFNFQVIDQRDNRVVVDYKAPMFEVVP